MPQIACPVCGFAYAASNITNHLQKAHKGIFVSQTAAATVGLVACTRGQVVLNAAALRKHQGIRKCQSAQSQPAACQRPATQLVAANAAHTESAPAQLEAERYNPLIQALDPAIFADEQAMQLDSDSHPALTTEDSLDSVFAEAEATAEQVARAKSLHRVEDAQVEIDFPDDASPGEVPDLSPISTPDLHAAEDGNHIPHVAVAVEEIQEVEERAQEIQAGFDPHMEEILQLEPAEDKDEEGETLPQLPTQPQHVQQTAHQDMDVDDMPADGIVVLTRGSGS